VPGPLFVDQPGLSFNNRGPIRKPGTQFDELYNVWIQGNTQFVRLGFRFVREQSGNLLGNMAPNFKDTIFVVC
jgi:hypothetical protein